jgi:hypothetical protein
MWEYERLYPRLCYIYRVGLDPKTFTYEKIDPHYNLIVMCI